MPPSLPYQRSARSGTSTSLPWAAHASLDQPECDLLLLRKSSALLAALSSGQLADPAVLLAAPLHPTAAAAHRHRAQFAAQPGPPVRLCQFDATRRASLPATRESLPVLSAPIGAALACVAALSARGEAAAAWRRLAAVDAHSTAWGELCLTLVYAAPPPPADEWHAAADALRAALLGSGAVRRAVVVCRSRRVRRVCGGAPRLREELVLRDGLALRYEQPEGHFSNPCASAAARVLEWLRGAAAAARAPDLLELHSGFGASTVALAPLFRRVLSVEVARALADAQRDNLALNGVDNVRVVRMDTRHLAEWLAREAAGGAAEWQFGAVLVDPPRGGLRADELRLLEGFEHILGVWCNQEAMLANLQHLRRTHRVVKFAMFDQFPFTDFLECAALLERASDGQGS
ncbi:hypothetical protein AB1Y20_019602 [Prymnesium parvum]|uniref:tRNA(Phe) (4-demethylwyosine(37)-C(7)) aminocarboxypropyltransferase n=1 Tax=Prymnesium parvum TaxID=97485 RepID=A0AB34JRI8_PRYPA